MTMPRRHTLTASGTQPSWAAAALSQLSWTEKATVQGTMTKLYSTCPRDGVSAKGGGTKEAVSHQEQDQPVPGSPLPVQRVHHPPGHRLLWVMLQVRRV
jgi:hypothetical protein